MRTLAWAFAAALGQTVLLLILRKVMAIWPVGVGGGAVRLMAAVIIGAMIVLRDKSWRRLRIGPMAKPLLFMGFESILVNVCWFGGMKFTTAANAAILQRLDLIFVLLIAAAMGYERLHATQWLVLPVLIAGAALVMRVHQFTLSGHMLGDCLIVVGAFFLASNAFVIRGIMRHMEEDAIAFYNMLLSVPGFLAVAAFERHAAPLGTSLAPALVWLTLLGVVSAIALVLYYLAMRRMHVWKLRALMLISPLMTIALEHFLWQTTLQPMQYLGAGLLIGGTAALVLAELRQRAAGEAVPSGMIHRKPHARRDHRHPARVQHVRPPAHNAGRLSPGCAPVRE